MPGKRMIDEGICIDKRLNSVSEGAENLFYRLLSKTDDAGRVFADASLIKGQIYPRRDISVKEIESRLKELHEAKDEKNRGLIVLYEAKNERYCYFPNFNKHQTLRSDIKAKISYPQPPPVADTIRVVTDSDEIVSQVSKEVISKKVSKQEVEDFRKIFTKDKEGLKRHLTTRGFKPAKIRSILNRVFGNIGQDTQDPVYPQPKPDPEVIKAAKKILKDLSTEALLELYYKSKDMQAFKNKLIGLGYSREKIDKIDEKLRG